jgi:hypothetical protein
VAEPKTRLTKASVDDFIDKQPSEQVRDDCRTLVRLMQKATGCPPEMWGAAIVGFGRHWWTGAGGKKTEWMITAFSPRKTALTIYLWPAFDARGDMLAKLGKHSTGKGCLYIKRLSDVHVPTLEKLIVQSVKHVKAM